MTAEFDGTIRETLPMTHLETNFVKLQVPFKTSFPKLQPHVKCYRIAQLDNSCCA